MKRNFIISVLLLFLLVTQQSVSGYDISENYTNLDGETIPFSQFEGELLLVEAFSTECSHCIDYHPTLAQVYDEFNSSITMLSLSVNEGDTIQTIKEFVEEHPTKWKLGLDINDAFQDKYGIPGTPSTLLFDTSGRLASCRIGNQPLEEISSEINQFLADPSAYSSDQVEDNKCPAPSLFSRIIQNLFFPLVLVTIVYLGYTLWQGMKNKSKID